MDDFQASMMEIFAFETNGFLESLEKILIDSEERNQGIRESVPEIFRVMHTIKSSSAMMSLDNISKMAHAIEDVFYYIRENNPTDMDEAKLTDIVLDCVDFIRRNMEGENEDPGDKITYINKFLDEIKTGKPAESNLSEAAELSDPGKEPSPERDEGPGNSYRLTVLFKKNCQMLGLRAFELQNNIARKVDSLEVFPENIADEGEEFVAENGFVMTVSSDKPEDEIRDMITASPFVDRILEEKSAVDLFPAAESAAVVDADKNVSKMEGPDVSAGTVNTISNLGESAEQVDKQVFIERRQDQSEGKFTNVAVAKLDYLIDLVGEIVVAEMEMFGDTEREEFEKSGKSPANIKKLILQIQEAALSMRMVPIKETFLKLNRLIRDMCRKQNKDIKFITGGEDTEVDKGIIDDIFSPLMHITRNSIDHGIESPEERVNAGKPPKGKLELYASAEGRDVVIRVRDDGRGLNKDKIAEKGINMGIVTKEQIKTMSDEEIHSMIFLPGFSTKKEVTEYSGRGVGMDVVNENMKKVNGKITVTAEAGKGTEVVLRIPLTMAVIDAIIINVGGESCAIPLTSVSEMFKIDDSSSIRNVNGDDMVLLRDECYKIVNLFDFYAQSRRPDYSDGIMLLVKSDNKRYVLFAESMSGRQGIVVKPIPSIFKSVKGISGCTVLRDGRVGLILDAGELYYR